MPALADPTTWRTKPYGSIGYLFILKPDPIFKARVNMVESTDTYPVANVDYDGVTLGAYTDTEFGMTVTFGTTDEGDDLGRNRLRQAANALRIRMALSSNGTNDGEVDIVDNAYITVWDDFRLWWRPPRYEPDGTEYMDYRYAVNDFNVNTPPVAIAGVGYAGTEGEITLDSSESYVTTPGATIVSRTWYVGDGVYTVGTSSSTSPTVEFPPGFRWVKLVATDSNGKVGRTRIPVRIEGDGIGTITNFQVTSRRLTMEGQEISFAIKEAIDLSDYPDGTLVMYWEEEYFGNTQTSLAGPSGREHMRFIGYLQKERTQINTLNTTTEITCVDVAQRLRTVPSFPWIIANADDPVGWSEMDGLNIDRYMHFLLNWMTTALEIAPFTWSGLGSTYVAMALDSNQGSPWDQVAELAEAICHKFTCDSMGQLKIVPDPMLQPVADRTAVEIVTLTPDDYVDLQYEYNREPQVGWLDSAAVKARQDKAKAIIVQAPGKIPGQGPEQMTVNHRLVATGAEFRAQEGHRYARENSRYSLFTLRLLHPGYAGIEPANMEWIRVQINDFEGVRGRTINARFLVHEVDYSYNHQTGQVECRLTLEIETTNGVLADVYIEPDEVAVTNENDPIFQPNDPEDVAANAAVVFFEDGYAARTFDFDAASPTYTNLGQIVTDGAGSLLQFEEDPFSPFYVGTGTQINGWIVGQEHIFRVEDILGAMTVTELMTFDTNWRNNVIAVSKLVQGHIVALSTGSIGVGFKVYYSTDGTTFTEVELLPDDAALDYRWRPGLWISENVEGRVYIATRDAAGTETVGYISEDYGATWDELVPVTDHLYLESVYDAGGEEVGTHLIVPGEGNGSEIIAYFGRIEGSDAYLIRSNGTTAPYATDITPIVSSTHYGPDPGRALAFGVSRAESDIIGMVGLDYGGIAVAPEGASGDRGVFWSEDGGTNWTTVVAPSSSVDYRACRVYADNNMIIFGRDTALGLCVSGAAPSDKIGNLTDPGFGVIGSGWIRDVWRVR
jgi:hypothetical protein